MTESSTDHPDCEACSRRLDDVERRLTVVEEKIGIADPVPATEGPTNAPVADDRPSDPRG